MRNTKVKTKVVAKKPAARRPASRDDVALRVQALSYAISVSGIDSTNYGAAGGWPSGNSLSRSRFEAPATIVKTAETFLAFLKAT
jgi:hypothetical protein